MTEEITALVKINPAEFGLSDNQAAQVEAAFRPMLEKMVGLEDEYNRVVSLPITPETIKEAHDLRMEYVRIRTGTAKIHKNAKAFYLAGGRFVDGWKNAQHFASQGKEEKLKAIEDYYENLERERIAKLQAERASTLQEYEPGYIPEDLGKMEAEVWDKYLLGVKLAYDQRIEAERKAEEERIAKEKAEAEEREKIRQENERLKAEAEAREKEVAEEKAKAAAERAELEAKAKAEAEARAKLEAEARERAAAEKRKQEEERRLREQAEAAPDVEKIKAFASEIESVCNRRPAVESRQAMEVIEKAIGHLRQVSEWLNQSIRQARRWTWEDREDCGKGRF